MVDAPRCRDLRQLGGAAARKFGVARRAAPIRRVDMLDPPVARGDGEAALDRPPVGERRDETLARRRIAVEGDQEAAVRSEEHTSELQSLMRISYAVFCLKKKTTPATQRDQKK